MLPRVQQPASLMRLSCRRRSVLYGLGRGPVKVLDCSRLAFGLLGFFVYLGLRPCMLGLARFINKN